MAKVLPMLFRIKKALPWMGLASATIIAGYGVLLITGNFMAITGLVHPVSGPESGLRNERIQHLRKNPHEKELRHAGSAVPHLGKTLNDSLPGG